MPKQDHLEVIKNQRGDWNRVAKGWEKWDTLLERNLSFVNYRLVGDARLRTGHHVLDLGSGTGYPALLAAEAVGGNGRVIGIDLSEEMVAFATKRSSTLGYSHVRFQTGDVSALPFQPDSFDAVISRFCLMFLPDIPKAIREIFRVLRPGGYFAAAVWTRPDKNFYLRIPIDAFNKFISLPVPAPDQPGVFRLANPGDLFGIAEREGMEGISDEELEGISLFQSAEEYFTSRLDLAPPIQNLFSKLSPEQKIEVEKEIIHKANEYQRGASIHLPMVVRIVVARKVY